MFATLVVQGRHLPILVMLTNGRHAYSWQLALAHGDCG
jgi:hypothetical protein